MRFPKSIVLPMLLLVGGLVGSTPGQVHASPPLPYQVVYSDGRTIEGRAIQQDHFFAHGRSEARLDGQLIFQPGESVRRIRNREKRVASQGPCLEMVNGDILPGQVERADAADPGRNLPAFLLVRLSAPLTSHAGESGSSLRVQADQVARLVTSRTENIAVKPGIVRLKSGALIEATSIRWRRDKILALTTQGIREIMIHDVAELHQPIRERIRLLTRARNEPRRDSTGRRVVFQVVNGARLTTREERRARDSSTKTWLQPDWALNAVALAPQDVAEVLFLGPSEVPLASLPAETLAMKAYFGKWNWARNRNVRGGRLDSGDRDGLLGVGTHAHSAIAFYLPPDAESFSSWLGIDRQVGDGGCAVASVYLNDRQGEPIWRSGFLQGGKPSARIGPLAVEKQKRLVLVTDFGHDGRPQGADPFDIRDEVDWIDAVITTKPSESVRPKLHDLFAFLQGWTISDQDRKRMTPLEVWNSRDGRWVHAVMFPMSPATERDPPKQPAAFNRPGVHFECYQDYREAALPNFEQMTPAFTGSHPDVSLPIPKAPLT
ncbi:MAG: NPCBM/NEW2 domain-containing protein, partial [Planctomycetales bacterium]